MQTLRVLVVDDHEDNGELLCEALTTRGYSCKYARDANAALAIAPELLPQVALLDVLMPDIGGYELGMRLRELPGLAEVCLIAITGSDRDPTRAFEAGFHGHMLKPVTLARLEATIAELMTAKKS